MVPKVEHLDAERANFDFFLAIPPADRREVKVASIKGSQMLEPLFESSGACAGCGETPYLKLLSPDVRRPDPGRERHRLLLDLRWQPPDDAVVAGRERPRARLVELAVRGQRGVRSRDAAGARPPGRCSPARCSSVWPERSATTSPGRSSRAAGRGGAADRDQRERVGGAEATARGAARTTRRGTCSPSPTRSSARASGSSAVTGGPTTSGSAGSTTCWRRGRERQRARARHAGLLEHRRPGVQGDAARSRGEVRGGRQADRDARTSGCSRRGTATSTSRRSRSARTTRRR